MKLYVYGAGGHGKVVAEILIAARAGEVMGFLDDAEARYGEKVLGLPVLGGLAWIEARAREDELAVVPAIGDNTLRRRIQEALEQRSIRVHSAIHPTASVSPTATLGPGTVVMAQAAINAEARIGRGVIVNTGAVVEHDVVIGDFVHISPRCALGGGARVGASAHIGIGASILPRITIGERSVIGGGAAVVRDIPGGVVAHGVPARVEKDLP